MAAMSPAMPSTPTPEPASGPPPAQRAALERQARAVFREFDADGNGAISLDEVQAMTESNKLNFLPAGVNPQDVMAALDKDGDGHITQDEWMECILAQCGVEGKGASGLTRSQSRRRALQWVRRLMMANDADVQEPFDGMPADAGDPTLQLRHSSEIQGDIDFGAEFPDAGEGAIPGTVLDTMDVVREKVAAAAEQTDRLESELKRADDALSAERSAREAAERGRSEAVAARDELARTLADERARYQSQLAERDARIAQLQHECRKAMRAQAAASTSKSGWSAAQAEINQRLAALLSQHKSEMAHMRA